jgi:hypothetical protein
MRYILALALGVTLSTSIVQGGDRPLTSGQKLYELGHLLSLENITFEEYTDATEKAMNTPVSSVQPPVSPRPKGHKSKKPLPRPTPAEKEPAKYIVFRKISMGSMDGLTNQFEVYAKNTNRTRRITVTIICGRDRPLGLSDTQVYSLEPGQEKFVGRSCEPQVEGAHFD